MTTSERVCTAAVQVVPNWQPVRCVRYGRSELGHSSNFPPLLSLQFHWSTPKIVGIGGAGCFLRRPITQCERWSSSRCSPPESSRAHRKSPLRREFLKHSCGKFFTGCSRKSLSAHLKASEVATSSPIRRKRSPSITSWTRSRGSRCSAAASLDSHKLPNLPAAASIPCAPVLTTTSCKPSGAALLQIC